MSHPLYTNGHSSDEAIDSLYSYWPNSQLAVAKEASVSVQLIIAGRQVTLTLNDTCEEKLLARLEAILAKYPSGEKSSHLSGENYCAIHGVAMKLVTKGSDSWHSHRNGDGWCKGKQRKQ